MFYHTGRNFRNLDSGSFSSGGNLECASYRNLVKNEDQPRYTHRCCPLSLRCCPLRASAGPCSPSSPAPRRRTAPRLRSLLPRSPGNAAYFRVSQPRMRDSSVEGGETLSLHTYIQLLPLQQHSLLRKSRQPSHVWTEKVLFSVVFQRGIFAYKPNSTVATFQKLDPMKTYTKYNLAVTFQTKIRSHENLYEV